MIDRLPGLPQLQIDHAGPIAAMPVRQGHDLFPQGLVTIRGGLVAVGTGTHADDT